MRENNMEKLTEIFKEHGEEFTAVKGCRYGCIYGYTDDESGCRCEKIHKVQHRLALYEDTGITPEEVEKLAVIVIKMMDLVETWLELFPEERGNNESDGSCACATSDVAADGEGAVCEKQNS
jgi:hypothetical protein